VGRPTAPISAPTPEPKEDKVAAGLALFSLFGMLFVGVLLAWFVFPNPFSLSTEEDYFVGHCHDVGGFVATSYGEDEAQRRIGYGGVYSGPELLCLDRDGHRLDYDYQDYAS